MRQMRWIACANARGNSMRAVTPAPEAGARCVDAHAGICAGGRPQGRSLPRYVKERVAAPRPRRHRRRSRASWRACGCRRSRRPTVPGARRPGSRPAGPRRPSPRHRAPRGDSCRSRGRPRRGVDVRGTHRRMCAASRGWGSRHIRRSGWPGRADMQAAFLTARTPASSRGHGPARRRSGPRSPACSRRPERGPARCRRRGCCGRPRGLR